VALEDKAIAIHILLEKEPIVVLVGWWDWENHLSKKMYHLFHNQYEKPSFLVDVISKDINDVKKNFYMICVIESYSRMKV